MFGINGDQTQPNQTTNLMETSAPDGPTQETSAAVSPTAPPMPNPTLTPPKLTLNPLPPTNQPAPNPLQDVKLEKRELMEPETTSFSPPTKAIDTSAQPADESLLKIKQQALQSLSPLVDKLDQDPVERYKTIMMLIQASDNPQLIPSAYDAANKITDEKARAQALLDVVNEINYFTHHGVDVPKIS